MRLRRRRDGLADGVGEKLGEFVHGRFLSVEMGHSKRGEDSKGKVEKVFESCGVEGLWAAQVSEEKRKFFWPFCLYVCKRL